MSVLRKLYYKLSPPMRFWVRRIWYFPVDAWNALLCKREVGEPPKGMIFIGSGDFKKQGKLILDLLVKYAGLKPDSDVLDVGCGIGRLAFPLTSFLSADGSYHGFDVVKRGIDWCNRHISVSFPNFEFLHVDLRNSLYNLDTDSEARNFIFPYGDAVFDCVVLTSVFTHMMPADVDNYLAQISRVLRPEGKCFVTFFLVNEEIEDKMKRGSTNFVFKYPYGDYFLMDKDVEEANVAYREEYLQRLFCKHRLRKNAVYYGGWSNSTPIPFFQDIMVLSKL